MSARNTVCRLCLRVPYNGFVLLDETSTQGLDVLSVKMNFDVSNDPLICEDCAQTIRRSLSFLLTSLNSEKSILLLDTGEDIDLREVYAHNSKQTVRPGVCICRFCIKEVEEKNYIPLDDIKNTYLEMFRRCMFTMDLNIINDPLICLHCRDKMESYFKFLRNCRDTEEKINTYRKNENIGRDEKIMLNDLYNRFSVSEVKREQTFSMDTLTGIGFVDVYNLKQDVKREFFTKDEKGDMGDHIWCTCNTGESECLGCSAILNEASPVTEGIKSGTVSPDINEALKVELNIKDEYILMGKPKRHSLTHKTKVGGTKYKCTTCGFKTIYKRCLTKHSLIHKTEAEVTMYRCTACDYKTKVKNCLKSHLLIHKPESEVTIYQCTTCDYKSRYINRLNSHLVIHKTEAEATMYKCTACDYETRWKGCLKRHSLTHKAKTDVTVYKCVECDFETIHKKSLTNHLLLHKTNAEVTMYKCTVCDYTTKLKSALKSHSLVHKTEAEVTMYKCTACDFKTKYKKDVKIHMRTHMTEEEVTMYKCTSCDFKTKFKSSLTVHLSNHKTEAEITMYKCASCDFKTKYRSSLKKHLLAHSTKAKVKVCR